jgi:DNA polymerase-3 subunit delta'
MPLKNIFCQEKAVSAIQCAFAGDKVAHAYIFAGPDGIGKFATAKDFAKLLLCKNPIITAEHAETAETRSEATSPLRKNKKTNSAYSAVSAVKNDFTDSCGNCDSCRLFDAGSHPDFEHVYKELLKFTKENSDKDSPVQFPIDVVREFVLDKVSQRPALSTRRVFVLTEAEKLNNESQNCLLKVLEEPPSYCCIILICTRPETLLPTIRSRCQILRFGPIDEEKIIEKLHQPGLGEKQVKFFARLANGSLGLAGTYSQLEIAEAEIYKTKTDIVNALANFEYKDSLELAETIQKRSKEIAAIWAKLADKTSIKDINRKSTLIILQIIISALHDTMLTGIAAGGQIVNFDQPEQIKKLALRFNPEQAAQKIAECFKTLHYLESSANERLILEQLLLNLAQSDKITSEL